MVSHEDIFVLDILENQQHISQLRFNFIAGQTLKKFQLSVIFCRGVFFFQYECFTFERGVFLSSISQ